MDADFSGYATKAGLKCTDGRVIMPDAFAHQDSTRVPLVWQHGHKDPKNVLGHAILENRPDGVYAYGFFNDSEEAKHARGLVEHGDISRLSIWANDLIERAGKVLHGAIREVSLVLAGANPGAIIENVTVRHSDGDITELDDEVIIYGDFDVMHSDDSTEDSDDDNADDDVNADVDDSDNDNEDTDNSDDTSVEHADKLAEIYNSLSDEQKVLVHTLIEDSEIIEGLVSHSTNAQDDPEVDVDAIYNDMTEDQKTVVHYLVGLAISDNSTDNSDDMNDTKKGNADMNHNVFEDKSTTKPNAISHADVEGIVSDALRCGSLKDAVESYALAHGIENIDVMFPEARAIADSPELHSRQMGWVSELLRDTRKSPFSRIKSLHADITVPEARAKGYIKGAMKKEEFFKAIKRVTTPTTVYKKQKLDRDDVVDITDFDVVMWLKGELRLMLNEELARAMLVGDGRLVDDPDKINEDSIRPVATDSEVYTTQVNVNIDDASSSMQEVIDAIVLNRKELRGTALPNLYMSETYISKFLLLKDTLGRRLYKDLGELASELRVNKVVSVDVLEEYPTIVCILFNPVDYVLGADRGGEVSLFDDFDIDYNQFKYLMETRSSGALTKLKSAMVVNKVAANLVLATPVEPDFDGSAITIVDQTGVVYKNAADDSVMNAAGSPYAVAIDTTVTVYAEPAAGYYFASSANDTWSFTGV